MDDSRTSLNGNNASRNNSCADRNRDTGVRLTPVGRATWFFRCVVNNILSGNPAQISDIQTVKFSPDQLELGPFATGMSPGRFLLERFLFEFPWHKLVEELGSVRAVDFGCGDGTYADRVSGFLGRNLMSYVGIDITADAAWSARESEKVSCSVVDRDAPVFQNLNFLFSITALEHVENDVKVMEAIERSLSSTDAPSIQLHVVPAPRSLWLYLTHGYRQYSKATILRLVRPFLATGKVTIVGIGGRKTAKVHKKWIRNGIFSRGGQKRFSDPNGYRISLEKAFSEERNQKSGGSPILYAVIIQLNTSEQLFLGPRGGLSGGRGWI